MAETNVQVEKAGKGRESELTRDQPVFSPATDIYEQEDAILVFCDMPGVEEKNVNVTLEDDELRVLGYQEGGDPEGMQALHRGYRTGAFRRSFTLATDIDREKIRAKLTNGVLRVTLPKAERAQPRRIQIEAG